MCRRGLLEEHGLRYDPASRHVEDYELWIRLLRFTEGHNLQEPMFKYTISEASVSKAHAEEQRRSADALSASQLRELDMRLDFSWEAKCSMLDIYRKHLWGELDGFSEGDKQVVPGLCRVVDAFLRREKCSGPRLLALREALAACAGEARPADAGLWRRMRGWVTRALGR